MFKKIIKKTFLFFGIQISKTPVYKKICGNKFIKTKVGNFKIKLNATHNLPKILKKWPNYSSNLPRMASVTLKKYPDLSLIDIGANIGDTVALLRSKDYFPIICIEGDGDFFNLLNQNTQQFKEVFIFKYFLGDKSEAIDGIMEQKNGTAKIIKSDNKIKLITLDKFLKNHPDFQSAKILKIDTDGYDLKIINGGLNYIKQTKPILFFEYDEVYFSNVGDDGLSTLKNLEKIGYSKILFYDNYGRFLISSKLNNHEQIKQLHIYIKNKAGAFPYYDLCIFHTKDDDIAINFIKDEIKFNI